MCHYIYAVPIIGILFICYYMFCIPVQYKNNEAKDKKSALNRARRLRKIGNKLPPPFPNGWFAIATSNEIKKGTAKNIDCLGENFVVFRSSKSNEVFVLDAYCPHLGANLGLGGIVKDDCIECPFHQWKFNGVDGNCVDIPYSENFAEVEKFAKIRKWISNEINGLIFVWHHAENDQPWELPDFEIDDLWFHGSNEFLVNSHIQDIPENGADRAHLQVLHGPSVSSGMDIRHIHNNWLPFVKHIWDAKWSADDKSKHLATINLTHVLIIFSLKLLNVESDITQIGPGFVVLILKGFFGTITILQTTTPIEPLVQKLAHYFYAPRYLGWFTKFAVWAETVNVARDVMIWNNKTFVKNPLLPKEEKQIKLFRNWFGQFYSENSKTFAAAHETYEW